MTIISVEKGVATKSALPLPNLFAWAYRQGALRALYRRLPLRWRSGISRLLVNRLMRGVKFTRTERWKAGVPCEPKAGEWPKTGADRFSASAGANIYAYARGQFGLGESARLYARALLDEGYPIAVHDVALDVDHSMGDHDLAEHMGRRAEYAVNIIFVNPDYMDAAITKIGRKDFRSRYTIACWFWELEKFPEQWLPALADVDEILVSSRFVHDVMTRVTDKPVLLAPLPLRAVPDSGLERRDFGLQEDAFLFLSTFDFNSFLARKNPMAVIDAFRSAFPAGENGVQLLIKSINGEKCPEAISELLNASASDDRIIVRDEVIERSHLQALQRCADAYVSLHRSEGFGLGMAECMRLGKPVIATAWSGNMEFMTPDNSCLVDFRLVDVGENEYVHAAGQRWAEPDTAHAAEFMRKLVQDRDYGARIGARAASDTAAQLSSQAIADKLIQRLEMVARKRASP